MSRKISRRAKVFHHPAIQRLEARKMFSDVVVNTTADTDAAGTITLRDAIAMANADTTPATIYFDPTVFATPQTIVLSGTELELSNFNQPITLQGPSVGVTINANGASRALHIDPGVIATMQYVSVTNGYTTAVVGGGGVYNAGTLSMDTGFIANSNATAAGGGGIYNDGVLALSDIAITGNTSSADGAGLENQGFDGLFANASLTDVTFSGNAAGVAGQSNASGGGIASEINAANGMATLSLTNVTFSGNSATADGGGIMTDSSNAGSVFTNITISNNSAASGGGIFTASTQLSIGNSIVAGNTDSTNDSLADVDGAITSQGNNLVGQTDASAGWIASDIIGTVTSPQSADLQPLADNGGPTQTLLPLPTSRVIGSGSVDLIPAGVTTDQRGQPRTTNGTVDIGAVEGSSQAPVTIVGTIAASTVSFTESAQTLVVGQSSSYFVTVAPASGSGPTPTGSISFSQDGVDKGTFDLSDGQLTQMFTGQHAGCDNLHRDLQRRRQLHR